ncbi:hypothetical protein DUNSADRAFT_15187 [Dunaliella salina]|uniref:Uncharacterized protein n=1 Tax=Dunaliella salina TaxID=3046 RepID=A0ABQ7G5Z3_DUNSA|nr:hypothetical protein DUNSADRAFT_15187 [Dunaliella salina]|eukprot:KAF5829993.1 hypothetical protein DUNSADRAFT_15187 [Dunaliella salina]
MAEEGSEGHMRKERTVHRARLDVPQGPNPLERRLNLQAPLNQPSGKPNMTGPLPHSSVLDRLKQFIPQIQLANQELEQQLQGSNPQEFDIEGVEEGQEGGYIEMDLTCGLLDLKDADAVRAAEQALVRGQSIPGGEDADASTSSDSSTEEEDSSSEEDELIGAATGSGQQGPPQQQPADGSRIHRGKRSIAAGGSVVASASTQDRLPAGEEPSNSELRQDRQKRKAKRRGNTAPKISEL